MYWNLATKSYDFDNSSNSGGTLKLYAFPAGLTMIAGNMKSRQVNSSDPTTYQVDIQCQGASKPEWERRYTKDWREIQRAGVSCVTLRITVKFPNCWDGSPENSDLVCEYFYFTSY